FLVGRGFQAHCVGQGHSRYLQRPLALLVDEVHLVAAELAHGLEPGRRAQRDAQGGAAERFCKRERRRRQVGAALQHRDRPWHGRRVCLLRESITRQNQQARQWHKQQNGPHAQPRSKVSYLLSQSRSVPILPPRSRSPGSWAGACLTASCCLPPYAVSESWWGR